MRNAVYLGDLGGLSAWLRGDAWLVHLRQLQALGYKVTLEPAA